MMSDWTKDQINERNEMREIQMETRGQIKRDETEPNPFCQHRCMIRYLWVSSGADLSKTTSVIHTHTHNLYITTVHKAADLAFMRSKKQSDL